MKLIVQTCIQPFEIALIDTNEVIAQAEVNFPVAADLFIQLEKIIDKSGIKKNEIEEIGFVCGPGSFTGLRTGYAFAQALSRALDIPLKGIGVFEIYAKTHPKENMIVAFKRTKTDAFVAQITSGKINFFETPMTFVDITKLVDNFPNSLIYSNIFIENKKVKSKKINILETAATLQNIKNATFKLIYGNTCYVKTIY
ncbi:MAG: tRNA (adenosine(37)-N6)-threonylcarbamoyltransferase complex dimerization subunit type 1 TsaB [Alphaproteobacteria bacterium]|nr:tRNA (adenosine(37)-N6)-threonylcarbamoyltransferase complex dimerization subunit type 1 TsaB [Alphaproteobacteria bacterium]MBN2779902.1 tRNA (adenosine(37)-N6)-threonylcarbamoyltransferase complex dimerization subunit type 1 TsaB [Alphaproteobacteria bacterium]